MDERDRFRQAIYDLSDYRTYDPEVERFHASTARTKIVSSPARTSKSYAAWKDVYPDVLYHGACFHRDNSTIETQRIWIVPPNYDLAKEFDYAWEDLVERKEHLGLDYQLIHQVRNPGQGNMKIHLRWGKNQRGQDVDTIIEVRSAANERQLQSEELDIVLLSEAARLPEQVWSKYLSTRCGRSVWATTPDLDAAWIYKEIERGKANPSLSIESFAFTPRANPKFKYDRYWIEHQKAELRTDPSCTLVLPANEYEAPSAENGHDCFDPLIDCGAMKDAAFAEQFGGQWTFTRGRVVPLRTEVGLRGEPSHVIDVFPAWTQWADVHISIDYGFADPTVVMFWYVGPQQVILADSIYERELTPDDVAFRVEAMIERYHWEHRVRRMVGDPKKPEVTEVFRRRRLPIWDIDKAAQVDRKAGHLELMNMLSVNPKTREPYMLVHCQNVEVIHEWSILQYKDKTRDPNTMGAFKSGLRDDAYDCARYFVMSHPPVDTGTDVVKLADTDFCKARELVLKHQARRKRSVVPQSGPSGFMRAN